MPKNQTCYKTGNIGNDSQLVYYWSSFQDQPAFKYAKEEFYDSSVDWSTLFDTIPSKISENQNMLGNVNWLQGSAVLNPNLIVKPPTKITTCNPKTDEFSSDSCVPIVIAQCSTEDPSSCQNLDSVCSSVS